MELVQCDQEKQDTKRRITGLNKYNHDETHSNILPRALEHQLHRKETTLKSTRRDKTPDQRGDPWLLQSMRSDELRCKTLGPVQCKWSSGRRGAGCKTWIRRVGRTKLRYLARSRSPSSLSLWVQLRLDGGEDARDDERGGCESSQPGPPHAPELDRGLRHS